MDAKGRPTMMPHREFMKKTVPNRLVSWEDPYIFDESSLPTPIWQILAGSLLGGGMVTQGKYPIDPIVG